MALVACPECGGRVSTAAAACPHCGLPRGTRAEAKPRSVLHRRLPGWLVAVLAVGGCVALFVGIASNVQTPPAPRSITGIEVGVGCSQQTVDAFDAANREATARGASRRVENVYCDSSGNPRRVWLTGSIPWEPTEGSGRLAAKLLGGR